MLDTWPHYRRLRVITNIEEFEWVSLEDCLKELAEVKAVRKADKKKRGAMNRAVKREERKLAEEKKKLARAKLAALKTVRAICHLALRAKC